MIDCAGNIAGDVSAIQAAKGGSTPPQRFSYVGSPAPIFDDQNNMFGPPTTIGYGDESFCVREMNRDVANEIIINNHYSGKFYAASYIHLGVYAADQIVGVLQYGYAMNPASGGSVVRDTKLDEYLELNRMWLSDDMPRNAESAAIGLSIRYIRQAHGRVGWIQSFADERCGRLGVVYQACNFIYCGEHTSTFWELDGVLYHNSLATRRPELSKSAAFLQENMVRAKAHQYRQYRYIKILKKWAMRRLLLKKRPYPKPAGVN